MNGKFNKSDLQDWLSYALRVVLVAVAYVVIARTVLSIFAPDNIVSLVWPLSGLAVAVLLIGGARYWLGLFIGVLAAVYLQGAVDLPVAVAFAVGNTLEYLLAWWLLVRVFRINTLLVDTRDYYCLVIAGAAAAIVSASFGVGGLWLT
ncbi:MAG TPA: MASE1 domain-containing protein, partial [Pseudomonadales bacterium]|nr:MASE1 domain-containing protein [Pseudomonadales bacterium]